MPSPFPGMDPYLEHPDIFPGLHDRLVAYLSEALQPLLPSPYYADLGRRAWIEVSERYIGPDVNVLRRRSRDTDVKSGNGGVATAARTATRPLVIHVPHDERREPFVEIYTGRGKNRRLVTTIEVLSPSNKKPGEEGRDLYLRKQRELLQEQGPLGRDRSPARGRTHDGRAARSAGRQGRAVRLPRLRPPV